MNIPCVHFFTADSEVRCDAGRTAEHSTGLKAPDDCSVKCGRYTPCYDNWPDDPDDRDDELFRLWDEAMRYKP